MEPKQISISRPFQDMPHTARKNKLRTPKPDKPFRPLFATRPSIQNGDNNTGQEMLARAWKVRVCIVATGELRGEARRHVQDGLDHSGLD
jgi:hypothetical protein